MTNRELIAKLSQLPLDMEVWPFNADDSDYAPFDHVAPRVVTMYTDTGRMWFSADRWPDIIGRGRVIQIKQVIGL